MLFRSSKEDFCEYLRERLMPLSDDDLGKASGGEGDRFGGGKWARKVVDE